MNAKTWRGIRRNRLNLDKNTCQRCRKYFPYGKNLTVHHIIPRPIGDDTSENLISLCGSCHDAIEGRGMTRHEIVHNFYPLPAIDYSDLEDEPESDPVDWREIDWHIRVYGGVKDIKVARRLMAGHI